MRTQTLIRRTLGTMALPAACVLAIIYFGHHALFDDHGVRRLMGLRDTLADRQTVLESERARRVALEAKVSALHSQKIDPDLLDERAREVLGLARPDEIIIFKPH
jgi:cell division protein FtsB